MFESIIDYRDSKEKWIECREKAEFNKKEDLYRNAIYHENQFIKENEEEQIAHLKNAVNIYMQIPGYKDANERKEQCIAKIDQLGIKQQRKKKKATILAISSVVVVFILLLVWKVLILPMLQYNSAMKLLKNKNYQEAYSAFMELDDFKDSETRAEEIYNTMYDEAMFLLRSGEYTTAADSFAAYAMCLSGSEKEELLLWSKYAGAEQLLADKNYEAAIELFNELDSFQDSPARAQDALNQKYYEEAERSFAQGDYLTAIALYEKIGDTKKIRASRFQLAKHYEKQGRIQEAITLYEELTGYEMYILKLVNKEAEECITKGQYTTALNILEKIDGAYYGYYSDAWTAQRYYELYDQCTAWEASLSAEGSIVTFGRYYQDADGEKQPITWVVVEKTENKTLLVSEYALVFSSYDDGEDIVPGQKVI